MTGRPVWGDEIDIGWANASDEIKERFALVRLFWFYRMVDNGGPDGSDLDAEVAREAEEAARWFGPILEARAAAAEAAAEPWAHGQAITRSDFPGLYEALESAGWDVTRDPAAMLPRSAVEDDPELPQDPTGVDCWERYESPADQA